MVISEPFEVVSYFLEFAKQRRGQAWLDRHVHTWIAAGAPHLGAAQALRSTIFGDKFGLDAFVTNSEARKSERIVETRRRLLRNAPRFVAKCEFGGLRLEKAAFVRLGQVSSSWIVVGSLNLTTKQAVPRR